MPVETLGAADAGNVLSLDDHNVRETPNSAPGEQLDETVSLRPARGIGLAIILSVPFWLALAFLVWLAF